MSKKTIKGFGRRSDPRALVRLKVRFQDANALLAEYTHNISKGGLFVRSKKPFVLGEVVELVLVLPETEEEIVGIGKVIHVVPEDRETAAQPAGMGLEFLELSPEHRRRIEAFVEEHLAAQQKECGVDRREHPRFEARIRVRFGSLDALIDEYSHNISHGGIFIKTKRPKKLGERIAIILTHPTTGEELGLEGEVVRVVDAEDSRRTSHPQGMGVLFLGMDAAGRERIEAFIRAENVRNIELDAT